MSHAYGEVWQNGKLRGHFEYNGTCDMVQTRIRASAKEVEKHWRRYKENHANCTCGKPSEDVLLYTDYGEGFHWPGKACFQCMAITAGITWDELGDNLPIDGRPND